MIEQRQSERSPASARVEIIPPTGMPIQARLVDVSLDGARLEVQSVFGIPDQFHLRMLQSDEMLAARVVWREMKALGVVFV